MKKITLMALCLPLIVCSCKNSNAQKDDKSEKTAEAVIADDDSTIPDPTAILYVVTFKEVNNDGYDAQLRMWCFEDDLQIKLDAFFDERMSVNGKIVPDKAESIGERGVKLPITLHVNEGGKEVATDDVILTFTEMGGNLYKLHVDFVNEPSETSVTNLMSDYTMFLTDPNVEHIVNTLPFNIDKENIKLTTLLPELNKYVFMPELWTTVNYIKRGNDGVNLGENEIINIDESNRFFSYSWGDFNIELQGKYFKTDDDKIVMVLDQHDSTYDSDQNFHIFVIDPQNGTFTEDETCNFVSKEYIDNNSIFQVRRRTDGVVAVFADGQGGLDAKTLRFNGKTFQ